MTARPQESTQALGLVELDKSFDHEQEIRGVPAILSAPNLCQVCPILVGDAYHERLGFKGEQRVCKLDHVRRVLELLLERGEIPARHNRSVLS